MLGAILAAALMLAAQAGAPMAGETPMHHARGTFDVAITPVQPAPEAAPDAPGRMTLSKTFHGGLTGTGIGEMLATMAPGASGAYVAMERVTGSVDGHEGTFAMVHRGLMDKGAQDLLITIVPGSGTGDLARIAGVFHLTIEGGEHRYDLEYSLPNP
jgi:hypothetical protein